MPFPLEIGARAEQADIDAESGAQVITDAPGWFPALLHVTGAAPQLRAVQALFVPAANRGAVVAVSELADGHPGSRVVRDMRLDVHGKFDPRVLNGDGRCVDELASGEKIVERVAR